MSTEAQNADSATPGEAGTAEAKVPHRRRFIGRIASDRMDKTVTVEVVRYQMDTMYKKYVRVRRKYKAHDENNEFRTGDRVEIMESRPLSRNKRWTVTRLIERPA